MSSRILEAKDMSSRTPSLDDPSLHTTCGMYDIVTGHYAL